MNEILLRSSVTGTKDIDQTAIDALRTLATSLATRAPSVPVLYREGAVQ